MTLDNRTARRWGVPWFYGLVAEYREMRVTQYWIRPFNLFGRWFRNYVLDMQDTLNPPRDDEWWEDYRWDPIPCPRSKDA